MHAVGSVIDIQGGKFVVCGYRLLDVEGKMGMGYLLVPYPLGFMGPDSFSVVSADADYPVVHEGYRNEDTEAYDGLLEQVRAYGRETAVAEVVAAADEVAAELADMAAKTAGEE